MMIKAWLCLDRGQRTGTRQSSQIERRLLSRSISGVFYLFAPAYGDHVIWLVMMSVLPNPLNPPYVAAAAAAADSEILSLSGAYCHCGWLNHFGIRTPLSGPQNGHTMDLFNSDREGSQAVSHNSLQQGDTNAQLNQCRYYIMQICIMHALTEFVVRAVNGSIILLSCPSSEWSFGMWQGLGRIKTNA